MAAGIVIPDFMAIWSDSVLADVLQNQLAELHQAASATEKATTAIAAITAEMRRRAPAD